MPMSFSSSTTSTMNNTNVGNNNSFPFNFTAAGMDGSSYCQNIATSASSSNPQGLLNFDSQSSMSGQQSHGGGSGGGINDASSFLQSLLQGTHQQQQQQSLHQQSNVLSSGGSGSGVGGGQQQSWQSCRFCQQRFFATSERLFEHELSCPTHLQVQQLLQQQQQFQQQQQQHHQQSDALQHQLQLQQNQLQQQFKSQQQQNQLDSFSNLSNVFGGSMGQYGGMSSNLFQQQSNDLQASSQGQGLSSLLQQQMNNSMEQQQQGFNSQVSSQANTPHSSQDVGASNINEDQFESAVNNLPAFNPKPLTYSASNPASTTEYFPLSMPEDEEWLTPLHCFVRRYCVEVFVATPEDVAAPCMGKRNPVSVNQVGIRCPYCSPERMGNNDTVDVARARENGVVYPSLISRIYNSSINLLQRHLRSCAFVPPEILARYEELKSSNARSGASKKYWADSAARLGLLDTPEGIRLDKVAHKAHLASRNAKAEDKKGRTSSPSDKAKDAPPLVLPSDKRNTTAFTFHLMSQMQPCVFTEADRLGRRRGLDVGFAGLACRHCFGVYGSGRFFPSSVKTMADASKTLDVIYRHVMKCKSCPMDIKGGLRNLRDFHDSERSKMPFGNQRAFFVKIWGRLHEGGMGADAPALPSLVSAPAPVAMSAMASASYLASAPLPKLDPVQMPGGQDSLQGLYAMLKRESEGTTSGDHPQNKLTTEAA